MIKKPNNRSLIEKKFVTLQPKLDYYVLFGVVEDRFEGFEGRGNFLGF
jgi:hypothetical protein